jgi:hypothetical protein
MRKAIVIGMLGLALFSNRAAAQTAVEQASILRDFQRRVVDYTQRHRCPVMLPEAVTAVTPAPKIFTLPVALVFRQLVHDTPRALREVLPPLPVPLEYRLIARDLVIRDTTTDLNVAVLRDAVGSLMTK